MFSSFGKRNLCLLANLFHGSLGTSSFSDPSFFLYDRSDYGDWLALIPNWLFGGSSWKTQKILKNAQNGNFTKNRVLFLLVLKITFKNELDILNFKLTFSKTFAIRFQLFHHLHKESLKFEFFSKRADKITILERFQISKLDAVYSLLSQILCVRLRSNSLQSSIAFGILLGDSEGQNCKSSHQRSSVKNGVLRNFTKFTGKHLGQRPFFKVAGLNRDSGTGFFLWIFRNF